MRRSIFISAVLFAMVAPGTGYAQTACETVRADLDGETSDLGQSTMKELSTEAASGNCEAAADLARRAKDAQGVIETMCPEDTDLRTKADHRYKVGLDILKLPRCQD